MSDLISRQAAIDAINHICPVDTEYDCTLLDRVDVRCVLSDLPSAQPERKQGEWVLQSDDYHEYYECDQCGIAVGLDDVRNYCPNCGAKMEEGEET